MTESENYGFGTNGGRPTRTRSPKMANEAIGMIETRGLVALVQATDAMLKAASVRYVGWNKVGSGLCSVYVTGDVGSVRAAVHSSMAATNSGPWNRSQISSTPSRTRRAGSVGSSAAAPRTLALNSS